MTPEEKLVRTMEAALRSYDQSKALDPTPDPPRLEAALADVREGLTAWRKQHPLPPGESSITCPHCGYTSYHERDVVERYCGKCREFWGDKP